MEDKKDPVEKIKDIYKQIDENLAFLNEKIQNKTIKKDEYEMYKKYQINKENETKIFNVIEYIKVLKDQRIKIDEKLKEKEENFKSSQEELKKVEDELADLNTKKADIKKKLSSFEIKDEETEKIEDELYSLYLEIDEKKKEYKDTKKKFKAEEKQWKNDKDTLLKAKKIIVTNIMKSSIVIKDLFVGKSWNEINKNLDNYKEEPEKEEKTEKNNNEEPKQVYESAKNKNINSRRNVVNTTLKEEKIENNVKEVKKNDEDKQLIVPKESIFSKIKNFFKNIKNKDSKVNDKKLEENIKKIGIDRTFMENIKVKDDGFKDYIKQVAEVGLQDMKKQKVKEEQKELKEVAYKREEEKFGKDYAEKSYHMDDEER